ncbi:hybrid sensor histidine kinase/response regulator transcription factor [Larkinella sp.]|uniref:hybrid sensor histidine kinase/response regulator transcription factor n=1 Tax=Larkinella sp. TaxID=2034517 RepID=UPI003BAC5681
MITDRQGLPQAFVPSIVQDRQGFIWMATRDGLARYDGNQFKVFQPDPNGRPSLSTAEVAQIQVDWHGKLWISNEMNDLDIFDPVTEQFTNLSKQPYFQPLKSKEVLLARYYVDRHDQLWRSSMNNGLICLDLRTRQIRRFQHDPQQPQSLSHNYVIGIREGHNGNLWVTTGKGLDCIDWKTHSIRHYLQQPVLESTISGFWVCHSGDVLLTTDHWLWLVRHDSGQIRKYPLPASYTPGGYSHFTEDRHGNIYLAHHGAIFGFNDQQGLQLLEADNGQIQSTSQCLFVDQSDVLWVGTSGMGVRKYDLRSNPFQTAPYQKEFVQDLLSPTWLRIPSQSVSLRMAGLNSYNFRYTLDQGGRLWYNLGSSDFNRLDFRTGKTNPIPFPIRFRSETIGYLTCPMATDPKGRVWAVFDTTAFWYDERQMQWRTFPYAVPHQPNNTHQMLVIDNQALWLSTSSSGLVRIDLADGQTKTYTHIRNNPATLSSNALLSMASDPDNPDLLWIGTFGSGICIFNKKTGLTKRLSVVDGLPNNVIYSVIPDQHGDVWAGTNKGLCRINRRTLHIQIYTTEDGILADEFNRFHFLHLPGRGTADDRILMGGLEGITAFYPDHIRPDSFQPATEITTLSINNKPVVPGPDSPLGELPVQAIHELHLPDNQNFLTIGFAVLQFNKHDKNRYRYQLVGLDPTWVESQRPEAVFTDLRPGTYTLRLNATNLTGVWSPKIRTLRIVIHPPWWATWWAYAFYTIVGVGMAYGLFRNYVNRLKMQQSMALKEHEAAKLRELDEMKSRFFANVTHEFRTPLTLILSPAEQLLQQPLEPGIQRRVSIMETQARHLLRLINQLMDFSKLEANLMTVNASLGDLGQCVDQWLLPFREQASGLGIHLVFENSLVSHYWFDADKLEPIVYNLVSNALKFTPKGGQVRVQVYPLQGTQEGIELVVSDTGIGIPPVSLPLIFDRYYQVETRPEYLPNRPSGTGIGLSLVKELVESQQGQITVESREGLGTLFRICLPVRVAQPIEKGRLTDEGQAIASNENGQDERVRVLVVEDHAELAQFITESLPAGYEVDQARNGQDGLNLALERMPDVIISDVMMPVMDGHTLCDHLKSDLRTSHIPVVLLTARVAYEDRIEGLTRGADAYLTKPFHVQELQLQVRNLLENQRRLREQLQVGLAQPELPQPAPVDRLLADITQLIETNLDNAAFRVEDIEKYTNLSRMSLYRKMKAVAGVTPGDFIRVHRLKRSVQLLKEGKAVSETAYLVGFDSPAHFTKMFRQHYQVTPREYQAKEKS